MLFFFFVERRFGRPRRETTISSLRARRTLKNVVKCKCFTWLCACLTLALCLPDAQNCIFSWSNTPLVTSCSLDAQTCGRMMVFVLHRVSRGIARCFIYVCARRCSKTYVSRFWNARHCSNMHILILLDEPSRRILLVDRTKL